MAPLLPGFAFLLVVDALVEAVGSALYQRYRSTQIHTYLVFFKLGRAPFVCLLKFGGDFESTAKMGITASISLLIVHRSVASPLLKFIALVK